MKLWFRVLCTAASAGSALALCGTGAPSGLLAAAALAPGDDDIGWP
ncbi:hypothetical protein ACFQVC_39485 [Streptomyces monticola]|uniref:Uncharacterized protein n=1 Tax=Streptomyces monticola TaxID=2666263 RepID=A0ABW2JXS5_9ACTN